MHTLYTFSSKWKSIVVTVLLAYRILLALSNDCTIDWTILSTVDMTGGTRLAFVRYIRWVCQTETAINNWPWRENDEWARTSYDLMKCMRTQKFNLDRDRAMCWPLLLRITTKRMSRQHYVQTYRTNTSIHLRSCDCIVSGWPWPTSDLWNRERERERKWERRRLREGRKEGRKKKNSYCTIGHYSILFGVSETDFAIDNTSFAPFSATNMVDQVSE
jgi:hypothetical protein